MSVFCNLLVGEIGLGSALLFNSVLHYRRVDFDNMDKFGFMSLIKFLNLRTKYQYQTINDNISRMRMTLSFVVVLFLVRRYFQIQGLYREGNKTVRTIYRVIISSIQVR